MLWPLLWSAFLVGLMVVADVVRAYRGHRPAVREHGTGAFGTSRSSDQPYALQHVRAGERGRGRHAKAPWQIPWKGWKDIFWRTYQQIGEDRLLAVAAGVVFYGLLAVFPAVTASVSHTACSQARQRSANSLRFQRSFPTALSKSCASK